MASAAPTEMTARIQKMVATAIESVLVPDGAAARMWLIAPRPPPAASRTSGGAQASEASGDWAGTGGPDGPPGPDMPGARGPTVSPAAPRR